MYITENHLRSFTIDTIGKTFETPFFVPAISSIRTTSDILGYVDLLEKISYPSFLISAYDIYNRKSEENNALSKTLSKCIDKKMHFFLDNGNYESFWLRDKTWSTDKLSKVLDIIQPDFCFSFDVYENNQSINKHVQQTITSIAKTAGMQKTGTTIALIHSQPKSFPKIIRKVVNGINPEIIAIPERELGLNIAEMSQTISSIRAELRTTGKLIPIHILGCGNPISILINTLSGADIYDALNWFTGCVNPETGQMLHFSQKEFIDCRCEACKMKNIPYATETMIHNLLFYRDFTTEIRTSLQNDEIDSLIKKYLGRNNVEKIKKITGLK